MASVCVIVTNPDGKILLQERSQKETDFPLHLDFSAGGDLEKGENIFETAMREMEEEIGIELELDFAEEMKFGKRKIYVLKSHFKGKHFRFRQNSEVNDVKFFSKEEIEDKIKKGEKFHPEFKFFWENSKKLSFYFLT